MENSILRIDFYCLQKRCACFRCSDKTWMYSPEFPYVSRCWYLFENTSLRIYETRCVFFRRNEDSAINGFLLKANKGKKRSTRGKRKNTAYNISLLSFSVCYYCYCCRSRGHCYAPLFFFSGSRFRVCMRHQQIKPSTGEKGVT